MEIYEVHFVGGDWKDIEAHNVAEVLNILKDKYKIEPYQIVRILVRLPYDAQISTEE